MLYNNLFIRCECELICSIVLFGMLVLIMIIVIIRDKLKKKKQAQKAEKTLGGTLRYIIAIVNRYLLVIYLCRLIAQMFIYTNCIS